MLGFPASTARATQILCSKQQCVSEIARVTGRARIAHVPVTRAGLLRTALSMLMIYSTGDAQAIALVMEHALQIQYAFATSATLDLTAV